MKTTHFRILFITGSIFVMNTCFNPTVLCAQGKQTKNEQDQPKTKSLIPVINYSLNINQKIFNAADSEPSLDQTIPDVGNLQAKSMVENAGRAISLYTASIPLLAAEITTAAISALQATAAALTCTPACTNTLTGVRISYGVTANNDLRLFFQPLMFCLKKSKYGQGAKLYGNYELCTSGNNYVYTGATFTAASVDMFTEETGIYKDGARGVKIEELYPAATHTFNPTQDITGDVESVIVPFQELMAICMDAENKGKIRFWNAAEEITLDNVQRKMIKHTLLISSETVSATGKSFNCPSGTRLSNLFHLCPPSCNLDNFTFILATKP